MQYLLSQEEFDAMKRAAHDAAEQAIREAIDLAYLLRRTVVTDTTKPAETLIDYEKLAEQLRLLRHRFRKNAPDDSCGVDSH